MTHEFTFFSKMILARTQSAGSDSVRRLWNLKMTKLPMKEVMIQLSNEEDICCLLQCQFDDEKYKSLKLQHGWTVDFAEFPDKFMRSIEKCGKGAYRYALQLVCADDEQTTATLSMIKKGSWKESWLSLPFTQTSDKEVKKHLAKQITEQKAEIQSLKKMLQKQKTSASTISQEHFIDHTMILQMEAEITEEWKDKYHQMLTAADEKHSRALKAVEEEEQNLEAEVEQLKNKIHTLRQNLCSSEEKIEHLQEQIEHLQEQNEQLAVWKDKYEVFSNNVASMKERYKQLIKEMPPAKKDSLNTNMQSLQTDITILKDQPTVTSVTTMITPQEPGNLLDEDLPERSNIQLEEKKQCANSPEMDAKLKKMEVDLKDMVALFLNTTKVIFDIVNKATIEKAHLLNNTLPLWWYVTNSPDNLTHYTVTDMDLSIVTSSPNLKGEELYSHDAIDNTKFAMGLRALEVPQQPVPAPRMRSVPAPRPSLAALEVPQRSVPAPRVRSMERCTQQDDSNATSLNISLKYFDATREEAEEIYNDAENLLQMILKWNIEERQETRKKLNYVHDCSMDSEEKFLKWAIQRHLIFLRIEVERVVFERRFICGLDELKGPSDNKRIAFCKQKDDDLRVKLYEERKKDVLEHFCQNVKSYLR